MVGEIHRFSACFQVLSGKKRAFLATETDAKVGDSNSPTAYVTDTIE